MVKTYVDLAGRAAWLRDQAIAGKCPFVFCMLGNCRLFDVDAMDAGVKFSYKCCPLWRSTYADPGTSSDHALPKPISA